MPRRRIGGRARALLPVLLALAVLAWGAAQPADRPDLAPRALEPEELDPVTVQRILLRFELDRLVYPLLETSQVPGLVVAVAHGGEVLATEAYGSADLASGRVLRLDDPLWLASMTKVLTATVVHDLAADGVLALDDPLERWLPGTRMPPSPGGDGAAVTLRHLLTHTAGFDTRLLGSLHHGADRNAPLTDLVDAGLPPRVHPPGERLSYCNLCYGLLGIVIETATGADVETVFRERLFEPLSLPSGRIGRLSDAAHEAATARPHGRAADGIAPLDMPAVADPTAGQARLSGHDVGRLLAALTSAEPGRPLARGVRSALLSAAHRPHPDLPGWTLGMAEAQFMGHDAVVHGGDLPGAHSLLVIVPAAALAIFVHVNGESDPRRVVTTVDGVNDVRWALAEGLVAVLLGDVRTRTASDMRAAAPPHMAAAAPVSGPYRLASVARTSAEKLLLGTALLQAPLTVEDDGAVVLRTPDALSSPRRYLPVEPGLYRRDDGGDALAIASDAAGRPLVHLSLGTPVTVELVPPLERLGVVVGSVGAFVLLALLALVSWPLGAYTRWRRRQPRARDAPPSVRSARVAARAVALGGLAAVALVAMMLTEALATLTLSPALLAATWLALALTAAATIALAAATILGAGSGTGRRETWAFHALLTLAAAVLLVQGVVWNLTPWS